METKRIFNLIILDASGSMESIYTQALTGVNETIQTIRLAQKDHPELKQYLTLVTFSADDHYLNRILSEVPIDDVKNITKEDYPLYGCTALYDAMGDMITDLRLKIKNDDMVLVTVITDGYENASHHWSGPQVKSLVDELRHKGWTFAYIGANQDVEEMASQLGVRNAMSFETTIEGTKKMFTQAKRSNDRLYKKLSIHLQEFGKACMEEDDDFFQE